MLIKMLKVGHLECNCYILEIDGEILIIDPGDEYFKINKYLKNKHIVGVIITHHHFDHIGAVSEIVDKYKCKVYDKNNLQEGICKIGKFTFEVIFTPGHKEDAITIYFKNTKAMFCGDFIFKDGIGRCDMAGGNIFDMIKSIQKIKTYPRDTIIYPGHGDKTNIGYEIDNNIYFRDNLKYL